MSKLRILEEERRRPKRMPFEEREKIVETIKQMLEGDECVAVAVVHGGFLSSEVFRDIDVAVYLGDCIDPNKRLLYVEALREKLEKATGIGVDIQLLNEAPPAFVYRVLKEGRVIVERVSGLSTLLKIHALEDVRRLRKVLKLLNTYGSSGTEAEHLHQ